MEPFSKSLQQGAGNLTAAREVVTHEIPRLCFGYFVINYMLRLLKNHFRNLLSRQYFDPRL